MRTTLRFDLQSNAFDHFATPPFFLNFFKDLCSSFGSQRGAPKGRVGHSKQTSTDFVRGSAPEYIFTIKLTL